MKKENQFKKKKNQQIKLDVFSIAIIVYHISFFVNMFTLSLYFFYSIFFS